MLPRNLRNAMRNGGKCSQKGISPSFLNSSPAKTVWHRPSWVFPSLAMYAVRNPVCSVLRVGQPLLVAYPQKCFFALFPCKLWLSKILKCCVISIFGNQLWPTFWDHVVHVVLLSAQKQVIRIATQPVVALVQNKHFFWYVAMRNHPCNSMSRRMYFKLTWNSQVNFRITMLSGFVEVMNAAAGLFLSAAPKIFNLSLRDHVRFLCVHCTWNQTI